VFPIYSCTKIITAIACMQAVERGILKLDEPVSGLVPQLANLSIIKSSEGETVQLENIE
jgi:methyl acetate hydrolase